MPYVFGLLLLANVALLGYFLFGSGTDKSVEQARSQLVAPTEFVDNSNLLPPEIGEK